MSGKNDKKARLSFRLGIASCFFRKAGLGDGSQKFLGKTDGILISTMLLVGSQLPWLPEHDRPPKVEKAFTLRRTTSIRGAEEPLALFVM